MVDPRHRPGSARAALAIGAVGGTAVWRLRSWLPASENATSSIFFEGMRLPSEVGPADSGAFRVMCIRPGDWLIVASAASLPSDRAGSADEYARQGLTCFNLTDAFMIFEVCGSDSRDLLTKGCGIDFHPRQFPAGHFVRTRFAQIPAIIECVDERPAFRIFVMRSFAPYLRAWLVDSAIEFGGSALEAD